MSKDKQKHKKGKLHAVPVSAEEAKAAGFTPPKNMCDKEDCGVILPNPGQALCDRHDLAIRAMVARYLMPSQGLEPFNELIANAKKAGFAIDWMNVAGTTREVCHPAGWMCAICGGQMEYLDEEEGGAGEVWEHHCNAVLAARDRVNTQQVLFGKETPS